MSVDGERAGIEMAGRRKYVLSQPLCTERSRVVTGSAPRLNPCDSAHLAANRPCWRQGRPPVGCLTFQLRIAESFTMKTSAQSPTPSVNRSRDTTVGLSAHPQPDAQVRNPRLEDSERIWLEGPVTFVFRRLVINHLMFA
jgi:hypothetical protein